MPKLLSLLDNAGSHGAAFKFVADTPTITMSRLKAILTGGLPTFLDIGQSFSAAALGEDNLLGQLWSAGARVVVLGDDTWAQLAPASSYHGCHTFPSFDVHDLHTVDDGVWREVWPYLRPNGSSPSSAQSCPAPGGRVGISSSNCSREATPDAPAAAAADWEVLVAHYLGVDHAGHTYGGNSAQMYGKLQQMDEQISAIAEALLDGAASPGGPYRRTLLLVMGDHGQTLSGDHGGGSDEERDSVLLAFHTGAWRAERDRCQGRRQVRGDTSDGNSSDSNRSHGGAPGNGKEDVNSSVASDKAPACDTSYAAEDPATGDARGRGGLEPAAIPQIDLTPSLALLLGLPIPFGNLGKLSRRLWQLGHGLPGVAGDHAGGATGEAGEDPPPAGAGGIAGNGTQRTPYLDALRANALQVDRYLTAYAARGGLPTTELGHCRRLLATAQEAYASAQVSLAAAAAGSLSAAAPDAKAQDAVKQAAESEVLEAAAEAAYEGFLQAAGALARRKFTRFDLPLMVAGALLCVAACLGLHAWLLCRLWRASGGRVVLAAASVLTQPLSLAAVGLVALHAFGLFSAGWIQGEGRIHCYSLAAATLLLWLRAAVGAPAASASGRASASTASSTASAGVPGAADRGVLAALTRPAQTAAMTAAGTQSPTRGAPPRGQGGPAAAAAPWWRRQLWLAALALAALGSNVALQRYSLIDRWGSDPHDKRQLATAGTVGAAVSEAGAAAARTETGASGSAHFVAAFLSASSLRAAATLLPVLLLPLLLQAVSAPLMRRHALRATAGGAEGRQQRGRRGAAARPLQPGWLRAVFCRGCFLLVACWWLQQLLLAGEEHAGGTADTENADAAGGAEAVASAAVGDAGVSVALERLRRAARSASLQTAAGAALGALRSWPQAAVLIVGVNRFLAPVMPALEMSAPTGMKLWAAVLQLGLRWPPAAVAVQGVAGAAGAVLHLPLRLLLPRLVYALALAALVRLVLARCKLWLRSISCRTSRGRHGATDEAVGRERGLGAVQQGDSAEHAALLDASFCALASGTAVLTLLLGPRGPAVVLLLVVQGASALVLMLHAAANTPCRPTASAAAVVAAAAGCLLSLLGGQAFFLTGHFCEFSGLQYDSPFVGFDHMTWAATPLLFWINSFGALMLPALALPLVAAAATATLPLPHVVAAARTGGGLAVAPAEAAGRAPMESRRSGAGQLTPSKPAGSSRAKLPAVAEVPVVRDVGRQALVWLSASRSLALTVAVLSAGIQRHHVVVWALFAPKLVFEVCFAAATYVALMLAALGM
ncbi:hypothetical protein HXX76_012772 [Chlamydomonas incerta]|uniref:GPI ethanolamine phosphate transferase 3 n=1 Tax=Chlamydomonas incerta TaxID=51695 RepID=A0A835VV42_CHLIN|nr:hypothetical protein HXX76_012772 [Chlamydomonas incerta]|eukprot:KAG2426988.1 hypothetical protein HXX76_012772 [Chlamydomonas incerta]